MYKWFESKHPQVIVDGDIAKIHWPLLEHMNESNDIYPYLYSMSFDDMNTSHKWEDYINDMSHEAKSPKNKKLFVVIINKTESFSVHSFCVIIEV